MHDSEAARAPEAPAESKRQGDLVILPTNPPPAGAEAIWYKGRGGLKLRMMFAPDQKGGGRTRGTVLVCPGRTEPLEKYFEVARELQARNFDVAVFDWPGQGLSQRMHKSHLAGHVRTFGIYVDALKRGVEAIEHKAKGPYILLAHSMGGAISLEALRTKQVKVVAAAFCSPMWGLPVWFFQRWYARTLRFFGFGGMIIRPPQPEETFETNPLTHDRARWQVYRDLIAARPELAVGEPTIAWFVAALNTMRNFHETSALGQLRRLPSLVAIAGDEVIVKPAAQRRVARQLKAAKVFTVRGAGHEILMETDDRRQEIWRAFDEMLKKAGV